MTLPAENSLVNIAAQVREEVNVPQAAQCFGGVFTDKTAFLLTYTCTAHSTIHFFQDFCLVFNVNSSFIFKNEHFCFVLSSLEAVAVEYHFEASYVFQAVSSAV